MCEVFIVKVYDSPVDYQAALDRFRKEEHAPANPVHGSALPEKPSLIDGYVDYQAAAKAWDKEETGKYTIYYMEQEDEGRL